MNFFFKLWMWRKDTLHFNQVIVVAVVVVVVVWKNKLGTFDFFFFALVFFFLFGDDEEINVMNSDCVRSKKKKTFEKKTKSI